MGRSCSVGPPCDERGLATHHFRAIQCFSRHVEAFFNKKRRGRAPPKSKTYSSARPRGRAPPKSKTQVAYTTAHPGIWAALRNCCYKGHKGVQHCRKGLPLFDAANLAKISVWPPTSFHGSHGEELTWPPTDPDQIARLIKVPLKFGCNFDRGSRSFLVRIGGHQI